MQLILAIVGSVTAATRLGRDLKRKGFVNVSVISTPAELGNGGCSHSVKLTENVMPYFLEVVEKRRIKVKGLYKIKNGERGEYIYESLS